MFDQLDMFDTAGSRQVGDRQIDIEQLIAEAAASTSVLIGCETSGTVRGAFARLGYDVWSCDLLSADDKTNRHIQDDVRNVMASQHWDLICIMHPPCTRLCNSGVRWLSTPPPNKTLDDMHRELREGAELFSDCWNHDTPCLAIENPVMHYHAKALIRDYQKFSQSVQPWQFASSDCAEDNVKKRTCFWNRNLPNLRPTGKVNGKTARSDCHNASPSKDRWKIRSKFHVGMAEAMADQWGAYASSVRASK